MTRFRYFFMFLVILVSGILNAQNQGGGTMRGGKYSKLDAGTRMPMIIKWPGVTKPHSVSDALVSQVDFLASFAKLTGQKLKDDAAPDSFDMLNALLGKSKTGRTSVVEQGNGLAIIKEIGNIYRNLQDQR